MLCLELELIWLLCWNCHVLCYKSPSWASGVWNQALTHVVLACTQKSTKQIRHCVYAAPFKIRVKRWHFCSVFPCIFPWVWVVSLSCCAFLEHAALPSQDFCFRFVWLCTVHWFIYLSIQSDIHLFSFLLLPVCSSLSIIFESRES